MGEGDIPTHALDPRLRASTGMALRSSSMSPAAWTAEEDWTLLACAALTSPTSGERLTWDEIVQVGFPNGTRSALDCIARYTELEHAREQAAAASSRHANKGAWAAQEDAQLLALVEELGADKWVAVGKRMATRTGKQCRERYHNHLDPSSAPSLLPFPLTSQSTKARSPTKRTRSSQLCMAKSARNGPRSPARCRGDRTMRSRTTSTR